MSVPGVNQTVAQSLWVELHPKLTNQESPLLDIRLLRGPSPDLNDIAWGLNCLWEGHHRLHVSIRPPHRPLCFSCFIRHVYSKVTELNLSESLKQCPRLLIAYLSHILALTTCTNGRHIFFTNALMLLGQEVAVIGHWTWILSQFTQARSCFCGF